MNFVTNSIFLIRLINGAEYLFQAKDEEEMMTWIGSLNAASAGEGLAGPSRSHTLPSGDKKDDKRRSFFTLKKK